MMKIEIIQVPKDYSPTAAWLAITFWEDFTFVNGVEWVGAPEEQYIGTPHTFSALSQHDYYDNSEVVGQLGIW
jgi:hypothetical protein